MNLARRALISGLAWSEDGNWIWVMFLHVVIKVKKGKTRRKCNLVGGRGIYNGVKERRLQKH